MTDLTTLTTEDFSLLRKALERLSKNIDETAGVPSFQQFMSAIVEAEGDEERAKELLKETLDEERSEAADLRRKIALLNAKLYEIEAANDKRVAAEAAAALVNGDEEN